MPFVEVRNLYTAPLNLSTPCPVVIIISILQVMKQVPTDEVFFFA